MRLHSFPPCIVWYFGKFVSNIPTFVIGSGNGQIYIFGEFIWCQCKSFVVQVANQKLKIKIYRNIILPVVFYGYETWSLTLREERKPRVFENSVLRRIFGPRRDEVTGEWRRLHNEELNDLYCSPNIVRVIK